jgi:hypothetical protein
MQRHSLEELTWSRNMKRGRYTGQQGVLRDQLALIQDGPLTGTVLAQFNNLELGVGFTHTWLIFLETDFSIDQDFDDI